MKQGELISGIALFLILPLGLAPLAAVEDVTQQASGGPSLTIYSENLALVRYPLERSLGAGVHTLRIDGLPASLDRTSVIVLDPGVTLLGAHSFRTYNEGGSNGAASMEIDVEAKRAIESLRLAFITGGISWNADYSIVIDRDDRTARVDGFANIVNNSGAAYEGAEVQLLAGTIQRGGPSYRADRAVAYEALAQAAPSLGQAAFGDYHLYTVSTPLTIRSGETRRIRMMGAEGAKAEKIYTLTQGIAFHRQYTEQVKNPVMVTYRIQRPAQSELGSQPMPGGQARVYQSDAEGRLQLLGISAVPHTPKGEDVFVSTGTAFDLLGTRTQTDYRRIAAKEYETAWRVELTNASEKAVTVHVIESVGGEWRMVESSHDAEKLSAQRVRFRVAVPAEGEAVLEYRIRVKN